MHSWCVFRSFTLYIYKNNDVVHLLSTQYLVSPPFTHLKIAIACAFFFFAQKDSTGVGGLGYPDKLGPAAFQPHF
eukprot:COSAG06_NODE_1202_length_10285_cov_57.400648_4_plen_75_part_00